MLIPAVVWGQSWQRTGVLKGATTSWPVVASDEHQYMFRSDSLFLRQRADRVWRELDKIYMPSIYDIRAWGGDTLAIVGVQYYWTTDGGGQWTTAPVERSWKIMPHRSWVVLAEEVGDTSVRITVRDPFTNEQSQKDFTPFYTSSISWIVERDQVVVTGSRTDSENKRRMFIVTIPSLDPDQWQVEEQLTINDADPVPSGGFCYELDSSWVIVDGEQRDTINILEEHRSRSIPCKVGDTWYCLPSLDTTRLYRYTPQQTWEVVDGLQFPRGVNIVGVQGLEMVIRSYAGLGPYRVNASQTACALDDSGLSSSGSMFTNGRYIAMYDTYSSDRSRFAVVLEQEGEPSVVVESTVSGMIRDIAFIDDVLWMVADSVYTYDPSTRTLTNEQFPLSTKRDSTYITRLPGGVGIATNRKIYYRADGSATWSVLADLPRFAYGRPFVGTNDGYLLVSRVIDPAVPEASYFTHRITMDGKQIGDSVLIGRRYGFVESVAHSEIKFVRHGDNIYFGIPGYVNAVTTDHGATWVELTNPSKKVYLVPTPKSLWLSKGTLMTSYTDLMRNAYAFSVPSLGYDGTFTAFCLDHHCYAVSRYGLVYIDRPTVSVNEPPLQSSTAIFPGTTAQIINVLGERIGTLPIVDGLLAPFDPAQLPMQPLWAVSGNVVVRVR